MVTMKEIVINSAFVAASRGIHLVAGGSLRGEGDPEVRVSLLAHVVGHALSVGRHVNLQVPITRITGIHCTIKQAVT